MEHVDPHFEVDLSETPSTKISKKYILKRYFNWAVVNHFVQSFMAIVLSLAVAACSLYLIVDAYRNAIDHPVWADIVLSLLLGVWVSGKPKFFSKNKVEKPKEKTKIVEKPV